MNIKQQTTIGSPLMEDFLQRACRPQVVPPSEDFGQRNITLQVPIDPIVCGKVIETLLGYEAAAPGVPVHLFLFSPGGCVNSGLAIIDVMEHITSPVFTYCTGFAASMAAVILAAGERGYRYILPHGRVMIHQTMGAVNGTLENMRALVSLQNTLEQELEVLLAEKTGRTVGEIHEQTRFDKWFSAPEAVGFGLVDHILSPAPKCLPVR